MNVCSRRCFPERLGGLQVMSSIQPGRPFVLPGDPWPTSPAHPASAAFLAVDTERLSDRGQSVKEPTSGLPFGQQPSRKSQGPGAQVLSH